MATAQPRITRVFGAVNIGSFRVSAMIMGEAEGGEVAKLQQNCNNILSVQ